MEHEDGTDMAKLIETVKTIMVGMTLEGRTHFVNAIIDAHWRSLSSSEKDEEIKRAGM